MSLVGPRPLLIDYLDRYNPEQRRRLDLRPGITGWCVVNGAQRLVLGGEVRLGRLVRRPLIVVPGPPHPRRHRSHRGERPRGCSRGSRDHAALPGRLRSVLARHDVLITSLGHAGLQLETSASTLLVDPWFSPGAVPWEPLHLPGGARMFFVPEESPMNHDAAVVVVGNGASVVNLNDARLSPSQLRTIRAELGGHVHLLLLQGAGASWFPLCYQYSPEHRRRLPRQKRMAKFAYAARAVAAVEPDVVAPFSGPPCFLGPRVGPQQRRPVWRDLPGPAGGGVLPAVLRCQGGGRPVARRRLGRNRAHQAVRPSLVRVLLG